MLDLPTRIALFIALMRLAIDVYNSRYAPPEKRVGKRSRIIGL